MLFLAGESRTKSKPQTISPRSPPSPKQCSGGCAHSVMLCLCCSTPAAHGVPPRGCCPSPTDPRWDPLLSKPFHFSPIRTCRGWLQPAPEHLYSLSSRRKEKPVGCGGNGSASFSSWDLIPETQRAALCRSRSIFDL